VDTRKTIEGYAHQSFDEATQNDAHIQPINMIEIYEQIGVDRERCLLRTVKESAGSRSDMAHIARYGAN
jgi:hypothetical protein